MDVLGDGVSELSLVDTMGDDLSAVRAARASFGKANKTGKDPAADERLTSYLASHGHLTPFEHTGLVFFVKAPLFVVRQWHRHRIGWSYNEQSRRYTEENIEFHVPDVLRKQDKSNKQGSYDVLDAEDNAHFREVIKYMNHTAFNAYDVMLAEGIAREQARMVLPQSLYTSMYATCNLRSLAHFVGLRDHDGAQLEIREYSRGIKRLAAEIYPTCVEALCTPT